MSGLPLAPDLTLAAVPQDEEAERCVLGSVIMDGEAIEVIESRLKPSDFHNPRHRDLYRVMLTMRGRGDVIDFATLASELRRTGINEAIGGETYLLKLCEAVPNSYHIDTYAAMVERVSIMRRVISAAGRIVQQAYESQMEPGDLIREAIKALDALMPLGPQAGLEPIGQILARYLDSVFVGGREALRAAPAVPTGLRDLDALLGGGLHPSNLILVGARPSTGKSALAFGVAAHAALALGKTVALFSVEMSGPEVAARLLCMQTGVHGARLREGRLNEREIERLLAATARLQGAPLWLDETSALPVEEIARRARRLHAEQPVDLVVVDYLQLLEVTERSENRVQAVSKISRSLKNLARELECPVLALAQLNRAVETRSPPVPVLADLRDGGTQEQDADVVIFLRKSDDPDPIPGTHLVLADVAKHRNGPLGAVLLRFLEATTRFTDGTWEPDDDWRYGI